ncbi:hypothetical protein G6F35_018080 [Rhizopus arrhizus]|nr:hypothetical protein G6F35_018080 [Rhizopus arrhizus]
MVARSVMAAAIVLSIIGSTNSPQRRYPGGLTACTITLHPRAARATSSRRIASPRNHVRPLRSILSSVCPRFKARTRQPASRNCRAASPPTPPVAPSTSTVDSLPGSWLDCGDNAGACAM